MHSVLVVQRKVDNYLDVKKNQDFAKDNAVEVISDLWILLFNTVVQELKMIEHHFYTAENLVNVSLCV